MASQETCDRDISTLGTYAISVSVLPLIVGFITMILVVMSVWKVKKMVKICEGITSSAHWLSRTAVRVGVGATAKQTLIDYAKSKPELSRLMNLK